MCWNFIILHIPRFSIMHFLLISPLTFYSVLQTLAWSSDFFHIWRYCKEMHERFITIIKKTILTPHIVTIKIVTVIILVLRSNLVGWRILFVLFVCLSWFIVFFWLCVFGFSFVLHKRSTPTLSYSTTLVLELWQRKHVSPWKIRPLTFFVCQKKPKINARRSILVWNRVQVLETKGDLQSAVEFHCFLGRCTFQDCFM